MTRAHISREERKSIIIKSAKRLILEQGMISFKFSELSKISACSNSTIYDFFNSKEDVIVAIFNENLKVMIYNNKLLLDNVNMTCKEKLLILSSQELLNRDSRGHHNEICNFFAINHFVCDHADPYISSEACRNLQQLNKQSNTILTSAISSGELAYCSEESLHMFKIKLLTTYRGLVALTMNKFKEELEWGISEDLIFNILANEIESMPWNNKEALSLSKIMPEIIKMKSTE